ncbi:MAG TPA: thioredoxin domain-containing protein [Bryobacteraceae bacterium]|nr:thioredoxin domain-containing protein [Bryobacteraceae bacterium]
MRTLLLLLPAALLFGQATTHKVAATTTAKATNFKETGSPTAPITLELFTDYQCPSCRMFYQDVLPQVISQYVAPGKVRLIHRDFPLPQHQYSRTATKYANAAGQVGMYDLVAGQIFKTQGDWEQNGNVDGEVAKVVPPGSMQKIREIVKNDAHLDDSVTSDIAIANRDGLNQTPTLVIVRNGKRTKIDGAVPFTILKSYLDQLLAKG